MPIENPEGLRRVLGYDHVAVVGASTTYEKAAHIVPAYLKRHGYEITPVNPTADEIFGERAYDELKELPKGIEIVEIFRPSDEVPAIVDAAIAREDVRAIWMQPGTQHDGAADAAEAAGLDVVQNRCMKVEHGQLIRNPMD